MLNTILLQSSGSSWANIAMIVVLIAVFYFFMIRPQQKRQNEIKKFREGLKVGDSVVTAGGIYGKVKSIDETTFSIEIARDVRITVDKGSVYPSAQQAANDAAEKGK
ncbi:MAG: preprotein translocase subunit YajC [Duncaniella sp.]|uniref:preprotein translocase subunit YajC n=1 Tax=Duncaniella sp. TaxID=2518496 RepID=UPI0023BE4DF0|nr:preprotein translocase subunit YajC [Duncaniella sp.]MDE5988621.1 preprotein translocase subunit YajC [Duncaniella sp.]